jgi:hypothetical protein
MTDAIRHFLTEQQRASVCETLSSGGSYEMAADRCGATVENIQAEETFDPCFAQKTCCARMTSEVNLLKSLTGAAGDSKQWRAAAWLLERLYPERYARRKPNTLLLKEHEQRLQQIADLVKSIAPTEVWTELRDHLEQLIKPSPVDNTCSATNGHSIEQSEPPSTGQSPQIPPAVCQSNTADRCGNRTN